MSNTTTTQSPFSYSNTALIPSTSTSAGNYYSAAIGNLSSPAIKKKKSIQYYRKFFVQQPKEIQSETNSDVVDTLQTETETPIENELLPNQTVRLDNTKTTIISLNQPHQPPPIQEEPLIKWTITQQKKNLNIPMKKLWSFGRKFIQNSTMMKKQRKVVEDLDDDEFSMYYKNHGGMWYFLKYYFLRFVQYIVMISSGCLAGSAFSTFLPALFLVFALIGFLGFFLLFSHSIQL